MKNQLIPIFVFCFILLFAFSPVHSQTTGCEIAIHNASTSCNSNYFLGHSVDADAGYLISSLNNPNGIKVFNKDLGGQFDLSGALSGVGCVAIRKNVIAKGDGTTVRIHRDSGSGFQFEQDIVTAEATDSIDEKRRSIALGPNVIAVGLATFDSSVGAVEIWKFDGNTWVFSELIQPPLADSANGETQFGMSVDFFGDRLAVGASRYSQDAATGNFFGAVYLYQLVGDTFVLEHTLLPDPATVPSELGFSVTQSQDLIVAGAPAGGRFYSWSWNGTSWDIDPEVVGSSGLGYAIDTDGENLVVSNLTGAGSVSLYHRNGIAWDFQGTFGFSGGDDGYGSGVALLGDSVVVGHYNDNTYSGNYCCSTASHCQQCNSTCDFREGSVHLHSLYDHSLRPEELVVETPPDPVTGWTLDQFVTLSTCTSVYGFSYGLQNTDPTHVSVSAVDLAGTVSESIGAEYLAVEIDNATGLYTVGCVLDLTPPLNKFFNPGVNQKIIRAQLSVDPLIPLQAGPEVQFDIVSGQGTPPVDLYLTIPGPIDTIPEVSQSSLDLPEIPRFLRGDINDSGFRNVTDAVFLLFYLFGEPVDLVCASAADVNDDSAIDLADPVYLLDSLYLSTAPAIPAPSAACGIDPTVDALTCESSICP